jgi:hypothetical protein
MGIDYAQLKAIFAPFADSGGRLVWPSATKMDRGASSEIAVEAAASSAKRKCRTSPSPVPAAGSASTGENDHPKALSKAHAYVLSLRKKVA